jgi:ppGpp synthetase/RelA/SpoT-type nucleotidyltranferase
LGLVLVAYDDALAQAQETVGGVLRGIATSAPHLRLSSAVRVKTTGTIVEKLAREQGMGLKGMQDIAGIRVVGEMTWSEQDRVGRALSAPFVDGRRPPSLKDRRVSPSYGYRAVHWIVHLDQIPIEIQVRTALQHAWAELMEKLADRWGRQVRYGGEPDDGSAGFAGGMTRADVLQMVMNVADQVHAVEQGQVADDSFQRERLNLEIELGTADPALDDPDRDAVRGRVEEIRDSADERRSEVEAALNRLRTDLRLLHDVFERV